MFSNREWLILSVAKILPKLFTFAEKKKSVKEMSFSEKNSDKNLFLQPKLVYVMKTCFSKVFFSLKELFSMLNCLYIFCCCCNFLFCSVTVTFFCNTCSVTYFCNTCSVKKYPLGHILYVISREKLLGAMGGSYISDNWYNYYVEPCPTSPLFIIETFLVGGWGVWGFGNFFLGVVILRSFTYICKQYPIFATFCIF